MVIEFLEPRYVAQSEGMYWKARCTCLRINLSQLFITQNYMIQKFM